MKKLTKGQVSRIKAVICNKNGSINAVHGYNTIFYTAALLMGRKVHYRTPGGPNKRTGSCVSALRAREVVAIMGYEVLHGNDAPRGGELGDHYYKKGRAVISSPAPKTSKNAVEYAVAMGLSDIIPADELLSVID